MIYKFYAGNPYALTISPMTVTLWFISCCNWLSRSFFSANVLAILFIDKAGGSKKPVPTKFSYNSFSFFTNLAKLNIFKFE
jgi:hypothetical protein